MPDVTDSVPIGLKGRSQGRTIGEGEFGLLTSLTWTTTELHSNREFATKTRFGERILGGPVVAALMTGLWSQSEHLRLLKEKVEMGGLLGMEVGFKSATLPGDTLWNESEVVSARPSRRDPSRGILSVRDVGINQRGEIVVEMTRSFIFKPR
jgi:itaconyl-CoA hydratase